MVRKDRSQADMGCDLFLRPAVNTSMWAWGPHPCGPQSQKEVATHVGWTDCLSLWDSGRFEPINHSFCHGVLNETRCMSR
jgi:hypothetical protein